MIVNHLEEGRVCITKPTRPPLQRCGSFFPPLVRATHLLRGQWCRSLTGRQVLTELPVKPEESDIKKRRRKTTRGPRRRRGETVPPECGAAPETERKKAPSGAAVSVGMINDWTLLCSLVKPL